jgi:hypothetical protein
MGRKVRGIKVEERVPFPIIKKGMCPVTGPSHYVCSDQLAHCHFKTEEITTLVSRKVGLNSPTSALKKIVKTHS